MRLSVLAAVLLSVGILNTVTNQVEDAAAICSNVADLPCGDGWSRISAGRCAKYFEADMAFYEAQDYCFYLDADLVSIHNEDEMKSVLCLTHRGKSGFEDIWIGVIKFEDAFINVDGSEFTYDRWYPGQPDNFSGEENCVESNHRDWGYWNDDDCEHRNHFVCAKDI